ncbi:hypothetical protein BD410DRAFT_779462 [Rickenella mellea]|uniref:Uncharacterized protein n=1 Tax=Rickenella mellea TaxID=50990 RepID=A0A4V3AZH5_9AGAM|nr:hypothetical protein BD410DRAFT_779462 [Rickenella mellea]
MFEQPMGSRQEAASTGGTLEPIPDGSSEISVLVLGEPSIRVKVIKKLRDVMNSQKFRLSLPFGGKRKH